MALVKSWLIDKELATEAEVKNIEKRVRKIVDEAVAKAKAATPPPPGELTRDIYVGKYEHPRMVNVGPGPQGGPA